MKFTWGICLHWASHKTVAENSKEKTFKWRFHSQEQKALESGILITNFHFIYEKEFLIDKKNLYFLPNACQEHTKDFKNPSMFLLCLSAIYFVIIVGSKKK